MDDFLHRPRLQGDQGIPTAGIIVFSTGKDANRLVAGIPALARIVREANLAGLAGCQVIGREPWAPHPITRAEVARLGGEMPVAYGSRPIDINARYAVIRGDALPSAAMIADAVAGANAAIDGVEITTGHGVEAAIAAALEAGRDAASRFRAHGKAILRSTSKPGDGIVSRLLNRPVSQAISSIALKFPNFRPLHATIGTAVIALAMVGCLLLGGSAGLIAGAVLFQAASIIDGVDGEVARATWRTSPEGARLDSLVDAATNLSFLGGVAINLELQGNTLGATLGFLGLALLAVGLFLIGRVAARRNAPFTFDIVKERFRSASAADLSMDGPSHAPARSRARLMQWLTFMTSRDFFALVFALLIAVGLATVVVGMFAIAAAGWLIVVVFALSQSPGSSEIVRS